MWLSKWKEQKSSYRSKSFPIDVTFNRILFSIAGFFIVEKIRIVQYPDRSQPTLFYSQSIGSSDRKITSRIFKNGSNFYKTSYKILSNIFNKSDETSDIRNSKYITKYPFIRKYFKDIVRDEKLEQLLKY